MSLITWLYIILCGLFVVEVVVFFWATRVISEEHRVHRAWVEDRMRADDLKRKQHLAKMEERRT